MHLPPPGLEHRLKTESFNIYEPRQPVFIFIDGPEFTNNSTEFFMKKQLSCQVSERVFFGCIISVINRDYFSSGSFQAEIKGS